MLKWALVCIALVCIALVGMWALAPPAAISQESTRGSDKPSLGEVSVGVVKTFPPYYMLDDEGNPTGFAVDTMNEVARRAGFKVTYRIGESGGAILEAIKAGDIDIIPSLGISDFRQQFVAFTKPLDTFRIALFVRRDTEGINGIDDMAGRTVSVVADDVGYRFLETNHPDIKIKVFPLFADALFALLSGRVDAFAYPEPVTWKLAHQAGVADRIKVAAKPLKETRRAMAVRKDNTQLLDVLDPAVRDFTASPQYQQIYASWFGKSVSFWTVSRVGLASAIILVVLLIVMAMWRYYSIMRLSKALGKSERQFRGLFENAEISIWDEDFSEVFKALKQLRHNGVDDLRLFLEGNKQVVWNIVSLIKVKHVNAATLKLFKAKSEKELIQSIERAFGPDVIDVFIAEFCAIWDQRETFRSEATRMTLDGEKLTVIISFQIPQFEEDMQSIPVSLIDITERKKVEKSLAFSYQRLKTIKDVGNKANETLQLDEVLGSILHGAMEIANASTGMIFLMNKKSNTLSLGASLGLSEAFNQSFKEKQVAMGEGLTGQIANSGETIFIAKNTSSDPRIARSIIEAEGLNSFIGVPIMAGQEIVAVMNIMTRPPGELNEKDVVLISAIGTHVGSSIHNARTFRQLQEVEAQLQVAKNEADIANKAKSEFLATMSHDLRTPLNAIMGFSDMMRAKTYGPLGDRHYEDYVHDIYNSGTLLVSLINDILDLSKIEAGKYELAEEPLDVSGLIQSSIRQLANMAKTNNQTLSAQVPPHMPHIRGDQRALIQIINNILSNAIKFTPKGGTIVITGNVAEQGGIDIGIADTGIGMTREGILKALKPFEQADGMHTRAHQGTGLGLHLCVNLMDLFGGTLDIQSEIDKGTTVILRFPPQRTILPG